MCSGEVIMLRHIFPIEDISAYNVHFARYNGCVQPLDNWVSDRSNWVKWQGYRPARDRFKQRYIFSLMKFYHEQDIWLFGGIFEILCRYPDRRDYVVELTEVGRPFIGRLKLRLPHVLPVRAKLGTYYDQFQVLEILREPYAGER